MRSIAIAKQTIAHVRQNPFWVWDFVTDPYSAEEFAFEMVQKLDPTTEEEQTLVEDIATQYVRSWLDRWDSMSRESKINLAEDLEAQGLDIDYNLI